MILYFIFAALVLISTPCISPLNEDMDLKVWLVGPDNFSLLSSFSNKGAVYYSITKITQLVRLKTVPQILTPRIYNLKSVFISKTATCLLLPEKVLSMHVLHIVDLSGMVVTSCN